MKFEEACEEAQRIAQSLAEPIHVVTMSKPDEYGICMASIAYNNLVGDIAGTFYPLKEAYENRKKQGDFVKERIENLEEKLKISRNLEDELRARIVELHKVVEDLPKLRETVRDSLEQLRQLRSAAEDAHSYFDKNGTEVDAPNDTLTIYQSFGVSMALQELAEAEEKAAKYLRSI